MRILLCVTAGVALAATSAAVLAFKEGPLPNMTGGFGDQTCRLCHFDDDLNAPGGSLTLDGVPATYTPGRRYEITVRIARAEIVRGGFEIAARFASGPQAGRQAGTWHIDAPRLQTVTSQTDPSLVFVQHTTAGTDASTPGSVTWTFAWTAPVSDAPVQFNVAANAANDDASPLGDFIYVSEKTARPK